MKSDSDASRQPAEGWKRFNDEFFSLRACVDGAPKPLVSKLAAEGVELIVDARHDNSDIPTMAADCAGAGVYYVPAPGDGPGLELSSDAASRYAKLAMRHKTCFVVDDGDEELLSLVSEQISFRAVPLDDESDTSR